MVLSRFEQFWLAEHQRLRDAQDPQLQQQQFKLTESNREAAAESQLLRRAVTLSERQGLLTQLHHWQHLRRLLTVLFALTAVLMGVGVSQATLSQTQPISLLFAVSVLLLPNLVMFLFWLLFTLRRQRPSGISGVGYTLLTLLQRKRSNAGLDLSWLRHVQQQRLLQPLMALATHGFWLLLAGASWLTLLLYLSFNQYSFQWATTILAAEQVQAIAQTLNFLPHLLFGAQLPALTDDVTNLTVANQAGRWLSLCVFTYGVVPRGLVALGAAALFFKRVRGLTLNLQADGYHAVVQALQHAQPTSTTIDADTDPRTEALRFTHAEQGEGRLVLSLDYEVDPNRASTAEDLGVVATYAEKQELLKRLQAAPSAQLQVRIATQLTPDRSSLRYLAQLAPTTQQLTVVLVKGSQATYLSQWQQQLSHYGVDYVVA